MPSLTGKNVLITGASSGIGEAVAVRFAQEGANVAINYLFDPKEAEAVKAKLQPGNHTIVQADVSQEDQVKRMFAEVLTHFGNLDVHVNNAGIQSAHNSDELEMSEFDRIMGVNIRGSFMCAREAIRHFLHRKGKGVIVNNSSVHQIIPKPLYLPYSVSKAGIDNMTRTLALEYAGRGIRINSVGPGATITPINKSWTDDPKARAVVESHIPMDRPATAEEIAAVFAFLASDDSSYITGQTIYACGGLTLYPEFRTAWSS